MTTYEGEDLPEGEIACPLIPGHKKFQDPQKFLDNHGMKGLQEEILQEGTYRLNPWFVTVKQVPLTLIRTGTVGVVVSSVGKTKNFHALDEPDKTIKNRVVEKGYKGIQREPVYEGYHAINTRIHKVIVVPTHEIELKWSKDKKPSSNYDVNLSALKLTSKDAYEFEVELTQKIQIKGINAPL